MRASTNPINLFSFPTPSLFGVIVRSTTTSQADLEAQLNAHFLPGLFNFILKSTGTVEQSYSRLSLSDLVHTDTDFLIVRFLQSSLRNEMREKRRVYATPPRLHTDRTSGKHQKWNALPTAPIPLLAFFGSFSAWFNSTEILTYSSSFLHLQVYLEVKVMIPSLQLSVH